jgi:CHAT domain-containing protein
MIKILFLAANPKNTDALRLGEEMRNIRLRLRLSNQGEQFLVAEEWAVRTSDLQGFLLQHNPDIVHFTGHGSRSGQIILEDEVGHSKTVDPDALKRLFTTLRGNIRCAVLNACYSEIQAKAIAESIDCVVGMSESIDDKSAISFAASFYQALGYGKDIRTAFDLGCGQIALENQKGENTPKLMTRPGIDASRIILTEGPLQNPQWAHPFLQ